MCNRADFPDVLAYPLEEAVRILESRGLAPSLQYTTPHKHKQGRKG